MDIHLDKMVADMVEGTSFEMVEMLVGTKMDTMEANKDLDTLVLVEFASSLVFADNLMDSLKVDNTVGRKMVVALALLPQA